MLQELVQIHRFYWCYSKKEFDLHPGLCLCSKPVLLSITEFQGDASRASRALSLAQGLSKLNIYKRSSIKKQ